MAKYKINGIEYDRFEDLPDDAKKLLEDKDNNGVPDIMENKGNSSEVTVETTELYEVNGKRYHSLEEIPEPLRSQVADMKSDFKEGRGSSDRRKYRATSNVPTSEKTNPNLVPYVLIGLALFLALYMFAFK